MSFAIETSVAVAEKMPAKIGQNPQDLETSPEVAALYVIETNGNVKIDWHAVEAMSSKGREFGQRFASEMTSMDRKKLIGQLLTC